MGQAVAAAILAEMGYEVVAAGSGAEALSAWQEGRCDLILMDVQMPDLDGCAATRLIREREAGSGERVPIIALTADTTEGDRQACLEAGMDDYLAKPLVPEAAREVIERAGRRPSTSSPGGTRPPAGATLDPALADLLAGLGLSPLPEEEEAGSTAEVPPALLARLEAEVAAPAADVVLDPEALRRLGELEARGALSVARVAELFAASGRQLVPALRPALDGDRLAELRRLAHTLKGNARDLGAHALASRCERLEAMARERALDGAGDLIGQIEAAWDAASRALDEHLGRGQG